MASDTFKFLHSKKRLDTESAINRQIDIAKCYGMPIKESNRYSKYHAVNCGHKNCIFCSNPRRIFDERTIQEKSFIQRRLHEEYDFDED